MRRLVWFSCGAASAVAAKIAIGMYGASCDIVELKKHPREAFQEIDDIHIFGYTADEQSRAEDFETQNPALAVEWILIDHGITKQACLDRLVLAGIALPRMYSLGFDHNNCIGCVKATSPGYWNRVRRLFPDVFDKRARQSRMLGARLARVRGERVFLDEIPFDEDGPDDAIDCGPMCQVPTNE